MGNRDKCALHPCRGGRGAGPSGGLHGVLHHSPQPASQPAVVSDVQVIVLLRCKPEAASTSSTFTHWKQSMQTKPCWRRDTSRRRKEEGREQPFLSRFTARTYLKAFCSKQGMLARQQHSLLVQSRKPVPWKILVGCNPFGKINISCSC